MDEIFGGYFSRRRLISEGMSEQKSDLCAPRTHHTR